VSFEVNRYCLTFIDSTAYDKSPVVVEGVVVVSVVCVVGVVSVITQQP